MKSRKLKNQDSWASRNYTGGATHVRSNWCRSLGLPCASLAPICSLQEMISLSVTPHQDTSGLTSQMVRFLASSSFIKCNLPFPRSSLTQAKNMKSSSVLPPLQLMATVQLQFLIIWHSCSPPFLLSRPIQVFLGLLTAQMGGGTHRLQFWPCCQLCNALDLPQDPGQKTAASSAGPPHLLRGAIIDLR